jgi:acyl-CoA thioesterase YciA
MRSERAKLSRHSDVQGVHATSLSILRFADVIHCGINNPRCSLMAKATATILESHDAPAAEPALRAIAMPADTNPHGDIFGGWLLCQMDLAGSTVATRNAGGRVVTVAITAMTFHRPVLVGDEVTCYCTIDRIGNSSITVTIESWVRRGTGTTSIKVTEGVFTYVHVGTDGRPQPIVVQSEANSATQHS